MKKFIKKLFCFHYYEDHPSVEHYETFMEAPNPRGFGHMKLVICNNCGKTKMVDCNFMDIKRINK